MVTPEIYQQQIHINRNNKKLMYVKLKKYIYGCLKSALLFYQNLSPELKKKGFSINLYDPYVAKYGKWQTNDIIVAHG